MFTKIALQPATDSQLSPLTDLLDKAELPYKIFRRPDGLIRALADGERDLVLIEGGKDQESAIDTIRVVRNANGHTLPIMVVTGERSEEELVVEVLRAGADDCVSLSQGTKLLFARMAALYRRLGESEASEGSPTGFRVGDQIVHLSPRLQTLAALFFANFGRTLSVRRIEQAVWGRDLPASSRALAALICRLRRVLDQVESSDIVIAAVHRNGYRLDRKGGWSQVIATEAAAVTRTDAHENTDSRGGVDQFH